MRKPEIVMLAGDEGNLNVGDQAMLVNLVRKLRERLPSCHITSFSKDPLRVLELDGVDRPLGAYYYFARDTGPVEALVKAWLPGGHRLVVLARNLLFVLAARLPMLLKVRSPLRGAAKTLAMLRDADAVLVCGGGNLNSIWWWATLWPCCAVLRAARALGKPAFLTGQGIGPITSRLDEWTLKWGLKAATRVGLRDSGDGSRYLLRLGIAADRISSPGDDAVDLPNCDDATLARVCESEGIPRDAELVIANFRSTCYTHEYLAEYDQFAQTLDNIIDRCGVHVVFVPMCYDEAGRCDDRIAASAVQQRMRNRAMTTIVTGQHRPEVIRALVGMGRLAVGVSYHFALFALTQGLPCFSMYENEYYRLKLTGLYEHFGKPEWVVPFSEAAPDTVLAAAAGAMENRPAIEAELLRYTQAMADRVNALVDVIVPFANAHAGERPATIGPDLVLEADGDHR